MNHMPLPLFDPLINLFLLTVSVRADTWCSYTNKQFFCKRKNFFCLIRLTVTFENLITCGLTATVLTRSCFRNEFSPTFSRTALAAVFIASFADIIFVTCGR